MGKNDDTGVGREVRLAMDGPDIEHDDLIQFIADRNDEDRRRGSSAGESRQKIGEFIDETGINGRAMGWMRQILKVADKTDGQAKAMDIILSVERALPMIRDHVAGQGTAEMFPDAQPEPVDAAPKSKPKLVPAPEAPPSLAGDPDGDDFEAAMDGAYPAAAE